MTPTPDQAHLKTDDELQAVVVGTLEPLNAKIVLADYDPVWPQTFELEANSIRAALGERALAVEHVGSTSVPGLCAKPVIDIVLVVPDSSDEPAYAREMEAAGYVLRIREPDWHEHRVFKGPRGNINLHVFSEGCTEVARMLTFRDWLRTHPDDLARYANAKRELAAREWRHVQHYADAKTSFIKGILALAVHA
jgi:GrpB-like predicted nucleotidyltransferase (UPF0157 family)